MLKLTLLKLRADSVACLAAVSCVMDIVFSGEVTMLIIGLCRLVFIYIITFKHLLMNPLRKKKGGRFVVCYAIFCWYLRVALNSMFLMAVSLQAILVL